MKTSKKKEQEQYWLLGNSQKPFLSEIAVGEAIPYYMFKRNGTYRNCFKQIKEGDPVIGYEGEKGVVAILTVQRMDTKRGNAYFKKQKELSPSISAKRLKSYPELEGIYFRNRSLSKLTKEQYDFILNL